MRFALGGKWGRSGKPPKEAAFLSGMTSVCANSLGLSREARAITPMPWLVRPNSCRRVRFSSRSRIGFIAASVLSYCFVHVENRAGDEGPGRQLRRIELWIRFHLADRDQLLGGF